MISKFFALKTTNPVLFYILATVFCIPLLALLALNLYRKYLSSSVKTTMEEANKKDEELKIKAAVADAQAESHIEKAKQHEENIKKIEESDDADWHKKI